MALLMLLQPAIALSSLSATIMASQFLLRPLNSTVAMVLLVAVPGIALSLSVDGTDIFAVYEATREARRRALEGGGRPILLEFMSCAVSHHSTSDDSPAYRNLEEVGEWAQANDPLPRLRQWLENKGLWNEQREQQSRTRIQNAVSMELYRAEKEKKAPLKSMFEDVYAEPTEEMEAQRQELKRLMLKYPAEYEVDGYEGGIQGLEALVGLTLKSG